MTLRSMLLSLAVALLVSGGGTCAASASSAAIGRGAYLATAADCSACHTNKKAHGALFAGGPPLTTAFGTFYAPNITPDRKTGIGNWTVAQFTRALREGIDASGSYLYPVMPFTSFTNLTNTDDTDLYAYLRTLRPVAHRPLPDDVRFPYDWRPLLIGWRLLFFEEGPLRPIAGESAEWNRGRYLAEAVAHCQECHTPRNFLGALERSHAYAGNPHGPDGQDAPDITSDKKDGIGDWRLDDLIEVLKSGMTPDGEFVGKGMAEIVDGTSKLTAADRYALALYIKSLPPLPATPK